MEIEAVRCAAGDRRHDFQEWYGKWYQRDKKRRESGPVEVDKIDPEVVQRELEDTLAAIHAHEELVKAHRAAIVSGESSRFSDDDVASAYATIESLKANLPALEAAANSEL